MSKFVYKVNRTQSGKARTCDYCDACKLTHPFDRETSHTIPALNDPGDGKFKYLCELCADTHLGNAVRYRPLEFVEPKELAMALHWLTKKFRRIVRQELRKATREIKKEVKASSII